ncbi:MAG TPA: peptidase M16, partial [Anaerolineae bacterium]|nr:peptidase M16 [Anaerolineae bacterium]
PDNTYGLDSGGDPKHIPDLSYEQFKAFHDTYYHPSNAYIYFYGDDNPETRLKIINDYLKDFEALDVDSTVPLQPAFDKPRRVTRAYAMSEETDNGNKGMLTVNWLWPESVETETSAALNILSYILVGTSASPLRKVLIDSGLGEDLTGGGVSGHLRQLYFSVGLKGIDLKNAEAVENLILETLNNLAENGIDPDMIEAALNTLEFRLREQNTGSFPRGLALMLGALTTWLYNDDPITPLAFEKTLTYLKEQLEQDKTFFQQLIKQHLLQNTHRVTLVLKPDPKKQQQEDAAEAVRLSAVRASMSKEDLQDLIEQTRKLKKLQETPDSPEALATIPHLTLADLDKKNKTIPIAVSEDQGSQVLYHNLFTNGIVYLDIGFNMRVLPQALLPYVSLFKESLLGIGTEKEDFVKLSQRIGRKTGGIWTSSYLSEMMNAEQGIAWAFLRGKATMAQTDDLLDIMRDVLLTVKLDNPERFKQMLLEEKAGHEAGLIPGGHSIVNSRLRAHFNASDWAGEQMGGVSNLFFARQLIEEVENNWPAVLEKLEEIRRLLFNRNAMLCNITLDEDNWNQFQPTLSAFLSDMPAASVNLFQWTPTPLPANEGLTIPAQVNYVGKGANLYELGYQYHGSMSPISNFLRSNWLWERVRVQGGAYGGFSSFDRYSGVFTFLSYRDPNLQDTLDIYDQTGQYLRQLELSKQELEKTIIGSIGSMDAYQQPDAKGFTSMVRHLLGYTDEMRQRIRDEILSTTPAHFKAFGDVLEEVKTQGQVVVLGSEEAIEAANAKQNGWLKPLKVL